MRTQRAAKPSISSTKHSGQFYSSSEGREIAYYRERALEEGIVVLEKVAPPSDFSVEGRKYTGEAVA